MSSVSANRMSDSTNHVENDLKETVKAEAQFTQQLRRLETQMSQAIRELMALMLSWSSLSNGEIFAGILGESEGILEQINGLNHTLAVLAGHMLDDERFLSMPLGSEFPESLASVEKRESQVREREKKSFCIHSSVGKSCSSPLTGPCIRILILVALTLRIG